MGIAPGDVAPVKLGPNCNACGLGPLTCWLTYHQTGEIRCAACAERDDRNEPRRKTSAPSELVEFIDHLRARNLRFFKGDFVTTDNVRIPVDFAFDRDRPAVTGPRRKGADSDE